MVLGKRQDKKKGCTEFKDYLTELRRNFQKGERKQIIA